MRNSLNQHGIPNLYVKRDHRTSHGLACQYRDPRYGEKEFGEIKQYRSLGSNVTLAIQQAITLNAIILPQLANARVAAIVNAPTLSRAQLTLCVWIKRYIAIQEEKLHQGMIKPNISTSSLEILPIKWRVVTRRHYGLGEEKL